MTTAFTQQRYQLGAGVSLVPVEAGVATELGRTFAEMEPWSRYPYPAAGLAAYLMAGEPHSPRFILRLDGVAAGAVGIRCEWLRGPYLQFLGILPACQGCGLGAAVLGWMESEAIAGNARNLWVCASDFNASALRFYARHGFRQIAVLDDLVQDGRDEFLLRKRLP